VLKSAAQTGTAATPLGGKELAVLSSTDADVEVAPVSRAAQALGAKVARVQLGPTASLQDAQLRRVCKILGKLYVALDGGTLESTLLRRIGRLVEIPVYQGLDNENHTLGAIADLLTICEYSTIPLSGMPLHFRGDPTGDRGSAFILAAALVGLEIDLEGPYPGNSKREGFVVDAENPFKWTFRAPAAFVDADELPGNRHLIVQAILLGTIRDS
jgi:ornithine carbamoyltransferase